MEDLEGSVEVEARHFHYAAISAEKEATDDRHEQMKTPKRSKGSKTLPQSRWRQRSSERSPAVESIPSSSRHRYSMKRDWNLERSE